MIFLAKVKTIVSTLAYFKKSLCDYPGTPRSCFLFPGNFMNDTAGPQALIPFLLLFQVITCILPFPCEYSISAEHQKAMLQARERYKPEIFKRGLQTIFSHAPPLACIYLLHLVMPFTNAEKEKTLERSTSCLFCNRKAVYIVLSDGTGARQFKFSHAKPFILYSIKLNNSSNLFLASLFNKQSHQLFLQKNKHLFISIKIKYIRDRSKYMFDKARISNFKGLIGRETFLVVFLSNKDENIDKILPYISLFVNTARATLTYFAFVLL